MVAATHKKIASSQKKDSSQESPAGSKSTPPEEIALQHASAGALLSVLPVHPRLEHGEIPLEAKIRPMMLEVAADCDDKEEKKEEEEGRRRWFRPSMVVSTRGYADVSSLRNLILPGHDGKPCAPSETNLWDLKVASTHNVAITRPSHDSWGILKIVLIFCDDFLRNVYELPYWHRDDAGPGSSLRAAVLPILNVLDVPPSRVVRCLLASLPPGVTIPLHHDSGDWVARTHRVHVPVVTDPAGSVLFRAGPKDGDLVRVDAGLAGHVFEMNNAARHAVSNHWSSYRVHLILDYVDAGDERAVGRRRVRLRPGEVLRQTRRSVDRAQEEGTRPYPSFLILGAQKCGTTTIYEKLMQYHPLFIRGRRRESHFFDWRWPEKMSLQKLTEAHAHYYSVKALRHYPSLMSGDSTPSYLLHPDLVIPRLKRVCPHLRKFIVLLRDPVDRAYSHYQMVTSPDGTPAQKAARGKAWLDKTFEEVVEEELNLLVSLGLVPRDWEEDDDENEKSHNESFQGSDAEERAYTTYQSDHIPMSSGSHSLLVRGLYELQLRRWFREFPPSKATALPYDPSAFLLFRTEDLSAPRGTAKAVATVCRHLDMPEVEVENAAAENAREYAPIPEEARRRLQKFYAPYNRRLGVMLGGGGALERYRLGLLSVCFCPRWAILRGGGNFSHRVRSCSIV